MTHGKSDTQRRRHMFDALTGGIVVSCQARPGNPFHDASLTVSMARAAELGGACGLRVERPDAIVAVRRATDLPVIGVLREEHEDSAVSITPTVAAVHEVLATDAPAVALDGTARHRPGNVTLAACIREIHNGGALAFADLARQDDLHHAIAANADAVGTTLSGSDVEDHRRDSPDFEFLAWLVRYSPVPVYAEGHFWSPEQVQHAFHLGATFVVIGAAITNPMAITSRFVAASRLGQSAIESERRTRGA